MQWGQFYRAWARQEYQSRGKKLQPKKQLLSLNDPKQSLNLGEALHLYWAKLEEEANYLTVPEEEEEMCSCTECMVR